MLKSSIQQTYNLQNLIQHGQNRHMVPAFRILAAIVFVESWTGALQVDLVFKHPRLRNKFIYLFSECSVVRGANQFYFSGNFRSILFRDHLATI